MVMGYRNLEAGGRPNEVEGNNMGPYVVVGNTTPIDVNIADGDVTINTSDIEIGAVELKAGEAHIGEVAGNIGIATPTIPVALTNYSSGDVIGPSAILLEDFMRVNGGTGILQTVTVVDKSGNNPCLHLVVFKGNPTEDGGILGVTSIYKNDYTTLPNGGVATVQPLIPITAEEDSQDVYIRLVAGEDVTFTAEDDLTLHLSAIRN